MDSFVFFLPFPFPLSFSCFSFCLPLASDGLLKGIIGKDSNKKQNFYFFPRFFIWSIIFVVLQRKSLILATKSIIFQFFMVFKWKYVSVQSRKVMCWSWSRHVAADSLSALWQNKKRLDFCSNIFLGGCDIFVTISYCWFIKTSTL